MYSSTAVDQMPDQMKAYIINGNPDGSVNTDHWGRAYSQCTDLGLDCFRSPSVYVVNNAEYATACPNYNQASASKLENFERGCMYAHKNVMDTIAAGEDDRVLVFEDDINIPASADAARAIMDEELRRTAADDILFLGNCYNGLCTHAMAVSKDGADKILNKVKWCEGNWAVDQQLLFLCNTNQLQCSFAADYPYQYTYDYPYQYTHGLIRQTEGITLRDSDTMTSNK